MALHKRVSGSDSFADGAAPVALSGHAPTDGSGADWADISEILTNQLTIPATGRVQAGTTSTVFAAARLAPAPASIPGGMDLAKPRYLISINGQTAEETGQERLLCGVYSADSNSFFGGGYSSAFAAFEAGDANTLLFSPVLVESVQGGNFVRFAGGVPHGGVTLLAGGTALNSDRFQAALANLYTVEIYVDEYQMIMTYFFEDNENPFINYYAYPSSLRTLRPTPFASTDLPHYQPCLLLRQTDVLATGGMFDNIFWTFNSYTPQEVGPIWQPVEGLFIARANLDFQSGLNSARPTPTVRVPVSNGPYLIHPPSRYRDVEITCQMIVIDNGSNPAYLDVNIGPLEYEVLPFTRLQLALPAFTTPIKVNGGGNRAKLYMYSEPIAYAFS